MKSFRLLLWGGIIFFILVLILIFRISLMKFLVDLRVLPQYFSNTSFSYENWQSLKLENQSLQNQLEVLNRQVSVAADRYHYVSAEVYSRYPFNNRGLITIAAGSADGLKAGLPVLAAKGIVLGKILAVQRTESEIQTIFDPNWKESVKIGGAEALLAGGANPSLQLIPQEAQIKTGDKILNFSADFPPNALIGEVAIVQKDEADNWLNASLDLPYDIQNLGRVLVITDFP